MQNIKDTAFSIDTSSIKFGSGVTEEVGWELNRLGCKNVMIVTDNNLTEHQSVRTIIKSLDKNNIKFVLFDQCSVEPTDTSFKNAINFAIEKNVDGFIGVGGGSSMDTAKAANLYSTYPNDFMEYVNAPIGNGTPVPGPLKPLIAIPTTTGTGSETTGGATVSYTHLTLPTNREV